MLCSSANLPLISNHHQHKAYMPCSMLSKLVAFDTNVYMNYNRKDARVITQVLHAWSLISPSIVILVPLVSFRFCLAFCFSI